GVLSNDSDPDEDPLTAILVSDVSHGSLTLNANGSFDYTPTGGYSGADSFTYKANDGQADSNTATVSITVNAVNDPPVANDDSYGVDEDQTLNVSAPGVLGNDSDPDEDPITAILVSDVSHGSLTLNSNGSFDYTPTGDYNGADSFTYKANDGQADSNTATVSITVNAVNDPPVANDDSYSTDEDVPIYVDAPGVLTNDSDVESDPLTAILVSDVSNGLLTLNSDGSFDYMPNGGFSGDDTFTYKANDGAADGNTATVTITVNYLGTPPINYTDTAPIIDGTVDAVWSAATTRGVHKIVSGTVDGDSDLSGTWCALWDNTNIYYLMEVTDDALVNDSTNGYLDDSVEVYFDADNSKGTSYDGVNDYQLILSWNSTTIELGGYSATDITGMSFATADTANGYNCEFVMPWSTLGVTPSADYIVGMDVHFNDDDNGGDTREGKKSWYSTNDDLWENPSLFGIGQLTGAPGNNPPVAVNDSYSTDEDQTLNVSAPGVLGNDSDPDEDPITAILVSDVSHGSLTLYSNGSFDYTPDGDYNGADSFTYKANDGELDSNTATVSITVNSVNDPPVAVNDSYETDEDTELNVGAPGVLTNDSDPESDPLTAILVSDVSHGSLTLNSNGSFDYTPTGGYSGADSFTYKANDGQADSNTATVSITVNPVGGWVQLIYDEFESGWGNWNDGGGDCSRYTSGSRAHQGNCAIDIQDNSGTASSTTCDALNLTSYTQLKINFWFYPRSMESGEDFWLRFYDGSTWHTVETWARGTDFENDNFYNKEVTIDSSTYTFASNSKVRFQCDASGNYDDIYLDEIDVSAR
ncbi:MAG: tandem-95 repeat protein, partial [Planctomycetes bacterium]|nr:tandem-95 repeat protein [Planctomycetota bacterium]